MLAFVNGDRGHALRRKLRLRSLSFAGVSALTVVAYGPTLWPRAYHLWGMKAKDGKTVSRPGNRRRYRVAEQHVSEYFSPVAR
jgi:hypothetical protein